MTQSGLWRKKVFARTMMVASYSSRTIGVSTPHIALPKERTPSPVILPAADCNYIGDRELRDGGLL